MLQSFWNFAKTSYVLPVIVLLLVLWGIAYKKNFSFVDLIADRVIEKMQLKYSPYGPDKGDSDDQSN